MPHTTWAVMNAANRYSARRLRRAHLPIGPGVYAWYRRGRPIYVGKADSLVHRVWANHLGNSRTIGGSAFRRNVAEALGFASPADIKSKRTRLTEEQLAALRSWILGCQVAWLTTPSIAAALRAEVELMTEFMPRLTKR